MREHTNYEAEFDEEKVKFAKTITNKEMKFKQRQEFEQLANKAIEDQDMIDDEEEVLKDDNLQGLNVFPEKENVAESAESDQLDK